MKWEKQQLQQKHRKKVTSSIVTKENVIFIDKIKINWNCVCVGVYFVGPNIVRGSRGSRTTAVEWKVKKIVWNSIPSLLTEIWISMPSLIHVSCF